MNLTDIPDDSVWLSHFCGAFIGFVGLFLSGVVIGTFHFHEFCFGNAFETSTEKEEWKKDNRRHKRSLYLGFFLFSVVFIYLFIWFVVSGRLRFLVKLLSAVILVNVRN